MEEIGELLAGGLTYGEAMQFFGSEANLSATAQKMGSGVTNNTNNVSVAAPVTVHATINSDMDVAQLGRKLGEEIATVTSARIPRI
jgi:acyl-CoA hydrolase